MRLHIPHHHRNATTTKTSTTATSRTTVAVFSIMMVVIIIVASVTYMNHISTSVVVMALQQLQLATHHIQSITPTNHHHQTTTTGCSRRDWFQKSIGAVIGTSLTPLIVNGADFAPGGTLITDKEIGILVNNPNASPLRKYDNSNVLFDKDYYYKFGTGIQYIEPPGNTSFPKIMPFTKSQQRYDVLKKYRERIVGALQLLQSLPKTASEVADPKTKEDVYQLRAMGLLANGLLASDNPLANNPMETLLNFR